MEKIGIKRGSRCATAPRGCLEEVKWTTTLPLPMISFSSSSSSLNRISKMTLMSDTITSSSAEPFLHHSGTLQSDTSTINADGISIPAVDSFLASFTSISNLPNEILLLVFALLPLPALISSRGVNQKWRVLVPLANIPSIRLRLLHLFNDLMASPVYPTCHLNILPHLRSFNRQQFLLSRQASIGPEDELEFDYEGEGDQGGREGGDTKTELTLPEEFRLWILEWPQHAVFSWLWPGLPPHPPSDSLYTLQTRINHLAYQNCSSSESWIIQYKHHPEDGQWVASSDAPLSPISSSETASNHSSLLRIRTQSDYLGKRGYSTDYLMCGGKGDRARKFRGMVITASAHEEVNKKPQSGWIEYLRAELRALEREVCLGRPH